MNYEWVLTKNEDGKDQMVTDCGCVVIPGDGMEITHVQRFKNSGTVQITIKKKEL